jgi:hypothetical protein
MGYLSYLRLGIVIGVLVALIGTFFYGQHVGFQRCEAKHLKADAVAQAQREKQIGQAQANDTKAAEANVQRETLVREITREVPKIIDRPIYRNVCIDADGVRLISRAVDAANGRAAIRRSTGDAAGVLEAPDHR